MQHIITYEILHFFFYIPIKTLAMEVELNQQRKKEKKRERPKDQMVGMWEKKGRHVGRKEESFKCGRMISCKLFFIVIL
jgi:hypothetical protein